MWQLQEAPQTTRPCHHAAACRAQQLVGKQAIPHAHNYFASPVLLSLNSSARHVSQGDNGCIGLQYIGSIAFFAFVPGGSPLSRVGGSASVAAICRLGGPVTVRL